jgi:hypothetical protein
MCLAPAGVGDLQGVFERLGYLAELGVDAVWPTPVHTRTTPACGLREAVTPHALIG